MTYATVDDIKASVPSRDLELLTDHDGPASAIDDPRLLLALKDATAEINGYIAKRVALPLADPPDMLRVTCRDIAIHRLYANIGRITETQKQLREAAIAYLRAVQDGKVSIGDETGGAEAQVSEGIVIAEGPPREMTRDKLKGF